MSIEDARMLLSLLSSGIVPFAVLWLQHITWPDYYKFGLAVLLSLIAGLLTVFISGDILTTSSIISSTIAIFMTSQTIYFGAFRGLKLEQFMFPKEAVINQAKAIVASNLQDISTKDAKEVLNPASPSHVAVEAEVKKE